MSTHRPPPLRLKRLKRPMGLTRLRAAARTLLVTLGLAAPWLAPPAEAAVPPIQRLADIRARLLAQDRQLANLGQGPAEASAPDGPMAQWFNWPNWTNWANWANWDNWNNWVKWSKF